MKASKGTSVDQCIAEAPAEDRPTIETIRKIITSAIPDAEVTMGYGKPYYKILRSETNNLNPQAPSTRST